MNNTKNILKKEEKQKQQRKGEQGETVRNYFTFNQSEGILKKILK